MTDPTRQAPDEIQREAERTALRNVRAALDRMEKEARRDRTSFRVALVVGCVAIAVLVGGSVLVFTDAKRADKENDAIRVALSTADLQYAWQVEESIRARLIIPRGVRNDTSAKAVVTLSRTGAVTDFRISRSSGNSAYDEAIREAVSLAGPFPPIPASADPSKPYALPLEIAASGVKGSR